jgi:hypothetical protein
VPFVFTLVALLAVGVLLLVAIVVRVVGALRRFNQVRGWLDDYLTDRSGMLRARSAALGVAVADLKAEVLGRGATEQVDAGSASGAAGTIGSSTERENHRA